MREFHFKIRVLVFLAFGNTTSCVHFCVPKLEAENKIEEYLKWHDSVFGFNKRLFSPNDVADFFAEDAVFILNDQTIANNRAEIVEVFKRMQARGTRTFFITPLTEKRQIENIVILRYNAKLQKIDGSEELHRIFAYVEYDDTFKIKRFVEMFQ